MGNSFSPLGKWNPLPIETAFKFPSLLPSWPQGEGFAGGSIDLGWFEVKQVSTFTKVWATLDGGPNNLGASFFEPSSIPDGFFMLGSYSQPNDEPLFGWVLVGKDTNPNFDAVPVLRTPVDYKLAWSSENTKIKQENNGYIWEPIPSDGYKAVGYVVTTTAEKPSLEKVRTVRSDLTDSCEHETLIWGSTGAKNMISVYSQRPTNRGIQSLSVPVGTFIAEVDGSTSSAISCLKSIRGSNSYYMPNIAQIEALFQAYSPLIYLHPDEHYQISSVNWYFSNGTLLYEQGKETSVPIESNGSNLPQGDSNDGKYWIDLPVDKGLKEKVKKGDLQSSEAYLHIKPMLGGTFTDISTWVFYPFNGPAKAKVEFINIGLGRIGEHVGDWEHLTLRISNFNGELCRVYFSEHSKGIWLNASQVEYVENSNKAVAYASLNGHAFYPKEGLVLQGKNGVGIRNDTKKSKLTMDTGEKFSVVSAEYLKTGTVVEPPWLNYTREWGPKIDYSIDNELRKIERFLPGKLKTAFKKFVNGLPDEILGEQGPTGPKMKNNWNGDEHV